MSFNLTFFRETLLVCLRAVPVTLRLALVSFLIAMVIGFFFALARINGKITGTLVTVYLSIVRGIPVVVQILIVYSMFPSIFQSFLNMVGSEYRIYDLNPIVYAYIVFSLNATAGMTEIFRSAILTVDKGQLEAAETAGMTVPRAYLQVIIPQALTSALPNMCTMATGLIKMTSLAFLMTVKDITGVAKIEAAYGYNYIEAYTDIWILYIVICLVIEVIFHRWEKHQKRYFAGRAGK